MKQPNVLWLMTDEQRCDSLGCYGSAWAHTPALDTLARQGAVFRHAYTPAPVCGPARASLVTGQYPHETGIWYNVAREQYRELDHLTARFHAAGYRSATMGKRHYCASNDAFQTEERYEVGEAVSYFGYAEKFDEADYDVVKYPAEPYPWIFGGRYPVDKATTQEARVVRGAMTWLEQHDRSNPFLLRLSFNAPHTPVAPPPPFDTMINAGAIDMPDAADPVPPNQPAWLDRDLRSTSDAGRLTAEQIAKMRRYYYGEVAFVDSQIEVLLDWMREMGLLENTIIAFVSDHGTHLGDYGFVQKQTFYEPVATVPYLFWYPEKIAEGSMLNTPVETRSLLPTLAALADIELPEDIAEPNLAEALRAGNEPAARPVFSEFTLGSFDMRHEDKLVMVRDGDWKLSVCYEPETGEGALYNLDADPYERNNLFGNPEHAGIENRLRGLIDEHLTV